MKNINHCTEVANKEDVRVWFDCEMKPVINEELLGGMWKQVTGMRLFHEYATGIFTHDDKFQAYGLDKGN